jgi:cold shock CspA family protein
MAQGSILWFDATRGFGFIRPDLGPRDVFMHVSELATDDPASLDAGTPVEFELVQGRDGRLMAHRVVPHPAPPERRKRPAGHR